MFQIQTERNPLLDQGKWADFRGSRFLIAHISNLKFQRELARLQKPFRRSIEKNEMDPEDSKNIVCQALASSILLDWDKVVDTGKNPVSYDRKLAAQALKSDEELREFVQTYSTDLANFREEDLEEKGND